MSWIKIETTLPQKPEVVKISAILQKKSAEVVGGLVLLWCLTDGLTEDGFLQYYTREEIDRVTGLKGFGRALERVGWIEYSEEGIRLVNYEKHNGRSAKKRAENARRAKASYDKKTELKREEGEVSHAKSAEFSRKKEIQRREDKRVLSEREYSTREARENAPSPSGDFVPPGVKEVLDWAVVESLSVEEAEKFWLWNQARGWEGCRDWEAAARLWMRRARPEGASDEGPVPEVRITKADVEVG